MNGFTGNTTINTRLEREVEELQIVNLRNNKQVKVSVY